MNRFIYIVMVCLTPAHFAASQASASDNRISESITFKEMPKGKAVYGIFEGRTPCREISRQLGADMSSDCDHLKWQLILFRDTVTLEPATFTLITEMFDRRPLRGPWRVVRGMKGNPAAVIYELDCRQPSLTLFLFKGDENVLFLLDKHREFRTGDQDFSYTLNRVRKVLHRPGR